MTAILPLATLAAVLALADRLAAHDWLVAFPLGVVVAAGIVLLAIDATPEAASEAPPSTASASLAAASDAGGSNGASAQ
jgi:hypothetical protein